MTNNLEHMIAKNLLQTMCGRGHLENHARELRKNGGFCVVRGEVSNPQLVDIAQWLTFELMGRDTLTTASAYWLIPGMVEWRDIVEREYTSASALSLYNLRATSNEDRLKEDVGLERVDGLRPLAIIPMIKELATLFPIGTASMLNLNYYLDTKDSMSALFVMDGATYDVAVKVRHPRSNKLIWQNPDFAIQTSA